MNKFTYQDYLTYTEEQYGTCMMVCEEETPYYIENIHQYKDKGYKIVLSDKEEAVQFINQVFQLENSSNSLKKEDIEQYNSSFITKDFKSKESDIVYKKKQEDIFFLIEQQSKIDYSMPYRILNYCIEIMRKAVDKQKLGRKDYKLPVVYAIVLYTGSQKWNAKTFFEECQAKQKGIQNYTFTKYTLVDINHYTEEELWRQNNFLSKMLLLEKAKKENQMENYIKKIAKEYLNNEQAEILANMIYNSVDRKVGEETVIEFMKNRKKQKGGKHMSALEEYLDSLIDIGLEKGRKQGIKEGIKDVVINMLKNQMDETTIKLMTRISSKELQEIKKQLI